MTAANQHHKPVSLASLGGMGLMAIAVLHLCSGASDRDEQDAVPVRRNNRAHVQAPLQPPPQPAATASKQCFPACVVPKFCVNGDCAQRVNSEEKQEPKDMGSSKPSGYLFASDPGKLHPGEMPTQLISSAQPPSP